MFIFKNQIHQSSISFYLSVYPGKRPSGHILWPTNWITIVSHYVILLSYIYTDQKKTTQQIYQLTNRLIYQQPKQRNYLQSVCLPVLQSDIIRLLIHLPVGQINCSTVKSIFLHPHPISTALTVPLSLVCT